MRYRDDVGDDFKEKIFCPIQEKQKMHWYILRIPLSLSGLEKIPGEASASRVFNYPFGAIEFAALANTVYHRSYEDDSPIEIREMAR